MKKVFSSGFFGLALLCFCMPWVTVSCQQQKIQSFTGIQMVTGTQVVEPGSGMFGKPKVQNVEPNTMAVVAVFAAVTAFFLCMIAGGASVIPAIIGVIVALALKTNIDQDILKQGQGLLLVTYEPGFWGYIFLMVCGGITSLLPSSTPSGESYNSEGTIDKSLNRAFIHGDTKKCPMCAETIKFEALVCKHCKHSFDDNEVKASVESRKKLKTAMYCPRCDMTYSVDSSVCSVCRMELIDNPRLENRELTEDKICPMCAETVKAAALKCRHCQHIFEAKEAKPVELIISPHVSKKEVVPKAPITNHDAHPEESKQSYEKSATEQPGPSVPAGKNNTFVFSACFVFLIVAIIGGTRFYKTKTDSNNQNHLTKVSNASTNVPVSAKDHKRVSKELAVHLSRLALDANSIGSEMSEVIANPFKYADFQEVALTSSSNPAYTITGIAGAFYGNSNAMIWVYNKTPNGYKQILYAGGDAVKILKTKNHGYSDILIPCYDHRLKKMNKAKYKYNGDVYQEVKI